MKLPSYSAEASLGRSSIAYTGAAGHADGNRGAIIPASCAGVNCDWARTTCFGSLDLDPISCGLYYGCCQGAGTISGSDCRANPCDPGCPADLCLVSLGLTISPPDKGVDRLCRLKPWLPVCN